MLAVSSGTDVMAALAISLFAALFAPPFLWTLRAGRLMPDPSPPAFRSVLTIIGSFYRSPGYNWIWPRAQGVFFEL